MFLDVLNIWLAEYPVFILPTLYKDKIYYMMGMMGII
jgi:hypothetical protein